MCQPPPESEAAEEGRQPSTDEEKEPFPWGAGAFDAHCHPTDTMSSTALIPGMRARAVTAMSTRAQDQALVAGLAAAQGPPPGGDVSARLFPSSLSSGTGPGKVVPAFGWHPWFSYQLYDDTCPEERRTYRPPPAPTGDGKEAEAEAYAEQLLSAKAAHLNAVLTPPLDGDGRAFAARAPELRPLSGFLAETRARLLAHPAALVGEVGLDRVFRLPRPWTAEEEEEAAAQKKKQQQQQQDNKPDSSPSSSTEPGQNIVTPGGREGRRLSPYRVSLAHQTAILTAQLRLAAELGRAVSIHGVQAHGALFDVLEATWRGHEREVLSRRQRRMVAPGAEEEEDDDDDDDDDDGVSGSEDGDGDGWEVSDGEDQQPGEKKRKGATAKQKQPKPYPPRICLHSYSGPAEMLRQYLDRRVPVDVYFSFSVCVNLSTAAGRARTLEVLAACPGDRVLMESDLHEAGAPMDAALEEVYRVMCDAKGWGLREGVERVARNYEAFITGR